MQAVHAGDAEGANEMSYSMGFLRQFCRIFQHQAGSTRIFFPDDKARTEQTSLAKFMTHEMRSSEKPEDLG